jgi:hypothetical protein
MSFDQNVFVNCPFDESYTPLLRPLLFTIIHLGLAPKIALESLDSGETRMGKIIGLIKDSRYAIHDLSRLQSSAAGEFYRLNMPFELGVDVGCRLFRSDRWARKKCLVLEKERHRYRAAISDLSGSDIAAHNDDPQIVVAEVRNWLNHQASLNAPGPSSIYGAYLAFTVWNHAALQRRGYDESDIRKLPVNELMAHMKQWTALNAKDPRQA